MKTNYGFVSNAAITKIPFTLTLCQKSASMDIFSGSVNSVLIQLFGTYCMNYTTCAAGSFARRGDPGCSPCPDNTHSQAGAAECDCDANFYRAGFNDCPPCPSNSESDTGSDICTCVEGYHRVSGEGASAPCTSEDTMY